MKIEWEGLEEEYDNIVKQRFMRLFRDVQKTDHMFKMCRKETIKFTIPLKYEHITIGKKFYDEVLIQEALVYTTIPEQLPQDFYTMDVFWTSLIHYEVDTNFVIFVVTKRENASTSFDNVKINVDNINITNQKFNFINKHSEHSVFKCRASYIKLKLLSSEQGRLQYNFHIELTHIATLDIHGWCYVFGKLKGLNLYLFTGNKNLKTQVYKQLMPSILHKAKRMAREKGCDFPDVNFVLREIKRQEKEKDD